MRSYGRDAEAWRQPGVSDAGADSGDRKHHLWLGGWCAQHTLEIAILSGGSIALIFDRDVGIN